MEIAMDGEDDTLNAGQCAGWRLGVLVCSENISTLDSNPMQLVKESWSASDQRPCCVSVCRQASIGTFRFSNEYHSVQSVGDNVGCVDSSLLQFPTVCKLTMVNQLPSVPEEVEVEPVNTGLAQCQQPDILLTSAGLIHSLKCFDREVVWYSPSPCPVTLERVVIGVDSDCGRQEAQQIVTRLYDLSKRGPVIMHQDFNFTVGFDAKPSVIVSVLETFPTLQGTVSKKTTIAVLPGVPQNLDHQEPMQGRPRVQSASKYGIEGPLDKGEYITEAISPGNFPLQNHFVVLLKEIAELYNIQHCQNIWVSPISVVRNSRSKRKQSVIQLDGGDSSERPHIHMAIALLYEDTRQLERYFPPRQFGQRHLSASLGLAYLHPELLYYLFPETLSLSRTFMISINVVKEEPLKIMHMKVMEVMRPQSQQLTTDKTIHLTTEELTKPLWKSFATRTWYLSIGEVFSVQTPRGKQFYKVHKMEPNLMGAGLVMANTDWECSVMALRAKTFVADLVPPNRFIPPPTFFESPFPPGLQAECDTLFSFFAPAFIGQSSTKPHRSPSILVTGPPGVGKRAVIQAVARRCRMNIIELDCFEFVSEMVVYAEKKLMVDLDNAALHSPVVLMLSNVHMLGKKDLTHQEPRLSVLFEKFMTEVNKYNHNSEFSVVVTALTSKPQEIPSRIHALFLQQLEMTPPTKQQREAILASLTREYNVEVGVDITELAKETAGFVLGDLVRLVSNGYDIAFSSLLHYCQFLGPGGAEGGEREGRSVGDADVHIDGVVISVDHFQKALDQLRSSHSDAIGAPKIPSVNWEDVGGLEEAKREILDTIQLPLLHPELFPEGLRRSGVLLYGAPGTGKTLLAKAVATECSLNFLSVKGPELINKYVGQSEENVREVFARARSAAPCVIFFDELDSIAPNRGRSGDSGGVMDRVVSQLLTELDGLDKTEDVFIIGATNRPDLLDPALLRPGRFDRLVYLDVSEDPGLKEKILRAITRKLNIEDGFDHEQVAAKCPPHSTGADLYALCSAATINALRREIDLLEEKGLSDEDWNSELIVTMADFTAALENLQLSVSPAELAKYKELHNSLSKGGAKMPVSVMSEKSDNRKANSTSQGSVPQPGDRPRMAELQFLEGPKGQRIRTIETAAHKWKDLALVLHFDNATIARIDRDFSTVSDSCRQMLVEWLEGSRSLRQPVTWTTLIKCLEEVGLTNMASRLSEIIHDKV